MNARLSGFVEFVRKQGVVGLAVGFLLGGAVSKVVSALVTDIVNPLVGLVLGSGLGGFGDKLRAVVKVPYADLPHMPVPTAPGHAGSFCVGFVGTTERVVRRFGLESSRRCWRTAPGSGVGMAGIAPASMAVSMLVEPAASSFWVLMGASLQNSGNRSGRVKGHVVKVRECHRRFLNLFVNAGRNPPGGLAFALVSTQPG